MADTCVKIKGTTTAAGATISASNFGRAHFVRIQTQAAANTITLKNAGGSTLGTLILVAANDSIIIEKEESDTLETSGNAVGVAVSSPR
mgnify:FL=1|jgi:hypothetical protein